jgi:predicted secreted hydrolase
MSFPKDFGPHPDFQTEWWYYTGNLVTQEGRRFGYQLTFFRRALQSPDMKVERSSAWAADQVYMAHFALTDLTATQFHAFERVQRGATGLAGAQTIEGYRVWLEDWEVVQSVKNSYHLHASQDGLMLDLDLVDTKGPILQGNRGYSQKGPEPGNGSYYYSQPRLDSRGTVTHDSLTYEVTGSSWKDHEYSTSALAPDQVGWDWFALQLSDGSELMVYTIRKQDGSIDPFSSGTFIKADGSTILLTNKDFLVEVTDQWRSPESGAVYPAGWTIHVAAADLELNVTPLAAGQELRLSFTYWEGAVQVEGQAKGQVINGQGYVELTGYAHSMQGEF